MQMSREQMQIRDTERAQLASEIHDEPLHRLSFVLNNLSRTARDPTLTVEASKTLDESSSLLKEVSTQLRQICMGLQPPVLKGGDVKMMVKDAVYKFQMDYYEAKKGPIKIDTHNIPNGLCVPQETMKVVYHVITEALNNVRKHAEADAVWITFRQSDGHAVLSIADNGRGMNLQAMTVADLVRAHHFGIVGMKEWARSIDASLTITSRKGGGTVITLTCQDAVGAHLDAN